MGAKNILEKVGLLKEETKRKKEKKNISEQIKKTERFIRCQHNTCSCEKELCEAFGLKICPMCKSILKDICGKVNFRNENEPWATLRQTLPQVICLLAE